MKIYKVILISLITALGSAIWAAYFFIAHKSSWHIIALIINLIMLGVVIYCLIMEIRKERKDKKIGEANIKRDTSKNGIYFLVSSFAMLISIFVFIFIFADAYFF